MDTKLSMRLNGKVYHPESLKNAGEIFCTIQDALLKETGRGMKGATITTAGQFVAHISQNGSVWTSHPKDWKPGDIPVYKRIFG